MLQEEAPEGETAAGRWGLPVARCPTRYMLADAMRTRMGGAKQHESMRGRIVVIEQYLSDEEITFRTLTSGITQVQRWWQSDGRTATQR